MNKLIQTQPLNLCLIAIKKYTPKSEYFNKNDH